ncbi:MAG: Ger(x)C family spore germination protein [Peptococcaceae bacterium]|nr:Ger(x)C family spore germination protein [Peptococcaceae bacterium]
MIRRCLCFLICLPLVFMLCGCWNYQGLDQMALVLGIAVDFDQEADKYRVTYEVADLTSPIENGLKGKIVEAEGSTLFDAARNAKRRLEDKLYFGSSNIIVVSQGIARERGIMSVIEWFLRDGECRETMCLLVSQEDSAAAILMSGEQEGGAVSLHVHDIIKEDNKATSSTSDIRMFQAYNQLKGKGISLTLPAFRKVMNDKEKICEANGMAVFKEDKLLGYLSPYESKYVLFIQDHVQGGILTLPVTGNQRDDASLEISNSRTKKSYVREEGQIKFKVETDTAVFLAESPAGFDTGSPEQIKRLEERASQMIEENIQEVIRKVQADYHSDIFGFGEMIYRKDYQLWRQLEGDWDELFPTVQVEVSSRVHLLNSVFIR